MKSQDIRQSFINFFQEHDHQEIASSPLVPHGDATLKFVNAGMVPFKEVFLGNQKPEHPRAVTAQKCLRVSGKHNDLENVGPSPRHHTFFEMLGNFSFGNYFKEEAICFGWELVTGPWGLDPANLFVTVFEDDDEAAELWAKISTLPPERIVRCGAKDNFWQMGDTGPCGPCSEIFVDLYPQKPEVPFEEGEGSGRYVEIWNLVFMQFERDKEGQLHPLPNPSIDTGAGLERVASVLQGVTSNYETDLFTPLLTTAANLAGTEYGQDPDTDTSLRVIADHVRAISFLLADGVIPGPKDQGYVLRRLLRRAVRHGMGIGFDDQPFLDRLVPTLGEIMGGHYDELLKTEDSTRATVRQEEEQYRRTLTSGARRIQEAIDRTRTEGRSIISGRDIFKLVDTYGQSIDTVQEIAEEEELDIDGDGFQRLLAEQKDRSRRGTIEKQKQMASLREALQGAGGRAGDGAGVETSFEGYDKRRLQAKIQRLALFEGLQAKAVETLEAGQSGAVVLDRTVFYAESGGQVGDQGTLSQGETRARVIDTQKDPAGNYLHFVEVKIGQLVVGQDLDLVVDEDSRLPTQRHHTATHLLHAALHRVLGDGARQAGSLVDAERLRFDFNHGQPLSEGEIGQIEDLVNAWTLKAVPMEITWRSREEALKAGAMALFGEKYGDRVRTVEVPGLSFELCGGCHVRNTGEIGPFIITSERGSAAGIRRIEAIAGERAQQELKRRQSLLRDVGRELNVDTDRAPQAAGNLMKSVKDLEQQVAKLRQQLVTGQASAGDGNGETEISGIKVLAREVPDAPTGELRSLADTLRDKMGSGVVVLGTKGEGKVSVIVTVSKDLTDRLNAGRLIKDLAAEVGGKGGGRPDFAQAGGKQPENLSRLLEKVPTVVSEHLG